MNIEKDFPVILIVGGIGLYFLVTGIMALFKKRMTVVNPHRLTVFGILKEKIEAELKVPEVPEGLIDRSPQMILRGKKVLVRAWFHIIFGLVALFILVVFLNPALFDKLMTLLY
ncbi:MAG: hypothetical protein ACYC69_17485 [Thermodesulfovibrionales bacterium]